MAETTQQPRSLIVTVYGLYGRAAVASERSSAGGARDAVGSAGWLSVALLVRLLADLGVDEPAVRSAISRLKRRGLLVASRRDGVAGYALSDDAREILDEGDRRIFTPPASQVADGWLLAVFSVPESERAQRHTLRTRLAGLGFGTAAPGVWVAPAHRYELTRAALHRHQLESYVDLFRADYLAYTDVATAVGQWWDLASLDRRYREFIAAWSGVDRVSRRSGQAPEAPATPWESLTGAAAFATWVRALTDWRRLPYLDPGLPAALLPDGWAGIPAATLFHAIHDRLAAPARDHVRCRLAAAPGGVD